MQRERKMEENRQSKGKNWKMRGRQNRKKDKKRKKLGWEEKKEREKEKIDRMMDVENEIRMIWRERRRRG